MGREFFAGFQLLHGVLAALAAIGFFYFLARTRFWLPKYVHVLAVISLAIGIWCVSDLPPTVPISQAGGAAKVLLALALPAMVYFFFVFYGGQQAAFRRKERTAAEMADLIERFLSGASLYRQEWNDFVGGKHSDPILDSYRRRCAEIEPLLHHPEQRSRALAELGRMIEELRGISGDLVSPGARLTR